MIPAPDEMSKYQRMLRDRVAAAPEYPAHFEGRGIVICAGGPRLFTCVWVLMKVLREVIRCRLPVEIWYKGAREMDARMLALLHQPGVRMVDATSVAGFDRIAANSGWALKPFAIVHSRFRDVLLLDADNIPVVDPEFLFDTPEYRSTGAIFWPDLQQQQLQQDAAIWEICGVPYREEASFESGQIVVDKNRCWQALLLTLHMNEECGFYYRFILGDKDTFHMAWRMLGQEYAMVPHAPELITPVYDDPRFEFFGPVLGQRDFAGARIFQHRNWPKWLMIGKNARYEGFLLERECLRFLRELAEVWDGRTSASGPVPASTHPGARWYRYVFISSGERWLELLPSQAIGQGAAASERRWLVRHEELGPVLEIHGDHGLTCSLVRHADGVWRGIWQWSERYAIELIPAHSDPTPD